MFPSNSNGNNDPIVYIDHSILHRHFCTDNTITTTPDIKPDDLPLSFFHLPSPYYNQCQLELEDHNVFGSQHHDDDDEHFLHQKAMVTNNSVSETITNVPGFGNITTDHHRLQLQQMPLKGSKRDRHSKINTANGLRDRRMRLSLHVARDFFGLQDMLGYDKASRTVEWLLIQAKPEIKKLMNYNSFSFAASKSSSSTSEAEVVSGIHKHAAFNGSISEGKPSKKEKNESRRQRKTSFRPLARDLRDKARERARARTEAKSMLSRRSCNETRDNNLNKFGSWSSLETGKESGVQVHNKNNPFSQPNNSNVHGNHMIDESLAIINKWSPSSIFNCLQNTGINQEQQQQQLTGSVLWQTVGGLQQ